MGVLSKAVTEYSRHYGNFKGVDFSNDHTQVHASRLAFLVNMYKDYKSGQGEALETMAGYRRRADFSKKITVNADGIATASDVTESNREIYGIFYFKAKLADGAERVVVHSGKKLYLWHNYPSSINIPTTAVISAPAPVQSDAVGGVTLHSYAITLPFVCEGIISVKMQSGSDITGVSSFSKTTNKLSLTSSEVAEGDVLEIEYYEGISAAADTLFGDMNEHKSEYFVFNNLLYVIDGKNYLVYDGKDIMPVVNYGDKHPVYVPTTYINIVPSGENADIGKEYEQRNILTPRFRHTFVADGTTREFYMNENNLDSIVSVKVYGAATTAYTTDLVNGKITFTTAPTKPEDTARADGSKYEQGYAGIEITASKTLKTIDGVTNNMSNIAELITKCTLCTTYDGRVFCTGNPDYHNYVFFCGRNSTGYADPSYFGILNYVQDGVGMSPITGIMCVSDTLMVLKSDTQQDSAIYFHTATDSSLNLMPRIYPSVQGLSGLGCTGACCNFLDDPIFISRLGVEGVGQLKIASERSNEHRSRLIDTKLVNTDLSLVSLEEWGGYLCVLTDGKIFLADSRQRYQDETGAMQYEWYYLENIGTWDNQYREYKYSSVLPEELVDAKIEYGGKEYALELAQSVNTVNDEPRNLCGTIVNEPDRNGNTNMTIYSKPIAVHIGETDYTVGASYVIYDVKDDSGEVVERHAYLCETKGNYTGGKFRKAVVLRSFSDNLFFGCENGIVCSFNFDLRGEDGELPTTTYSYDNRTIVCGCATVMDNCGIPHLTKTTIKRSTVIKTKSFKNSSAKVKVRTNKKPYVQIARINNAIFSFEDLDFSDLTFNTTEQSLFAIKEKEKQWVEKQYYLYSDEYLRPFALFSISYRYRVAGRYKG